MENLSTPWGQPEIDRAARFILQAHAGRQPFENLPPAIAPTTIDQAYDVQEAVHRHLLQVAGPIAGLKIATTTKVMQKLMGIDHPCGGAIFSSRIFPSGTAVDLAAHVHVMAECELAVRLAADLLPTTDEEATDGKAIGGEVSREQAVAAVSDVAPAFELVEDRFAKHDRTEATSLIADNAWNAGIVHGPWQAFAKTESLPYSEGILWVDGRERARGPLEDPFAALAWLATLAVKRGRPLRSGMVVITGSVIPTFELEPGSRYEFRLGTSQATMRCT